MATKVVIQFKLYDIQTKQIKKISSTTKVIYFDSKAMRVIKCLNTAWFNYLEENDYGNFP